jgi:hypothetical protein
MKATANYHIDYTTAATTTINADGYRWLTVRSTERELDGAEPTFFFPDDVPLAAIKAVEDAINDALEAGRAIKAARREAEMKTLLGDLYTAPAQIEEVA